MISAIALPLHEPILIFTVIITLVFAVPLFLKRINIPDIIGLIIAGVIIGPKGLNILSGDIALSIFGTIGLLYLMFLAGLEIDMNDFFRRRKEGTIYGILTFLFPFVPGFLIFYYVLDYQVETAILVATMLASHTLVSYPILGRLGIINHRIVTITISGTIIADTVVLIILGIVSDSVQGDLSALFWLRTLFFFTVFFVYVLYVLPMIARLVFKYQAKESSLQYIFVLAAIFVSASIAEFLKIEPLIGAFFTGLSLNRLIPRTSPLMNRTVFIGNTLFIPFFLISIGMMVDTVGLIKNPENWLLMGVLVAIGLGGKYTGAWILQKIYKFSNDSRDLVFGLSAARAASAIAIMIVGQEFNLVDESLLNSTVFLILVTCIVSSVVTQRAGQQLLLKHNEDHKKIASEFERIMVPIGNPDNIERLIDFSLLVKNPKSHEPLYPISVVPDGKKADKEVEQKKKILDKVLLHASSVEKETRLITRIDVNIIDGLLRSVKELGISKILVGWNGKTTTIDKLFGTMLDRLLRKTNKMVIVCKLESDLSLTGNLRVFLPPRVEQEDGFLDLIDTIKHIANHANRKAYFYGNRTSVKAVRVLTEDDSFAIGMYENDLSDYFFKRISLDSIPPNDMFLFVKARRFTLSHSRLMDRYPKIIQKYFCSNNLALIYPEQKVFKKGLFHIYNLN